MFTQKKTLHLCIVLHLKKTNSFSPCEESVQRHFPTLTLFASSWSHQGNLFTLFVRDVCSRLVSHVSSSPFRPSLFEMAAHQRGGVWEEGASRTALWTSGIGFRCGKDGGGQKGMISSQKSHCLMTITELLRRRFMRARKHFPCTQPGAKKK